MTGTRERRAVFGEAVDAYEAARPGYPDALVSDVLDYARLDGAPVLEVGAGTGKATRAFARRGLDLTCVEPDARMAAVLAQQCTPFPRTSVVVSGFEQWHPPVTRFGLLFSAQAWHWVDPATRWTLACAALRPGGAMALFWNQFSVTDPAHHAALTQAHLRHDAAELTPATLGPSIPGPGRQPTPDPAATADLATDWPDPEVSADDRFLDFETRSYRTRHGFTGERYADLLASISAYRMLPDEQRAALLADIAATVEGLGGTFGLETRTVLYLARTRG